MTLQDGVFLLMGLLMGLLMSTWWFSRSDQQYRKEVEARLRFLDENPAPQKLPPYYHDN